MEQSGKKILGIQHVCSWEGLSGSVQRGPWGSGADSVARTERLSEREVALKEESFFTSGRQRQKV